MLKPQDYKLSQKDERTILSTILTTKKAKQLIINYLAFC